MAASAPSAPSNKWPCWSTAKSGRLPCNERARTPFIHSKRLGPTQARDCRRVSPRKTNKSLQHKKMLELGRGVQTYEPRYFNGCASPKFCAHRKKHEFPGATAVPSRLSLHPL